MPTRIQATMGKSRNQENHGTKEVANQNPTHVEDPRENLISKHVGPDSHKKEVTRRKPLPDQLTRKY